MTTLANLINQQVRIVLVETSHPGNIGSVARAMKTMGLSQLILVQPSADPTDEQAIALAAGAQDVLARLKVVNRLEQALADCHLVFATSARDRSQPRPIVTPRAMSEQIKRCISEQSAVSQQNNQCAIVFGSERAGLTNQQLELAHYHVQIPANPAYSSLNLAQAVQIICYELCCLIGGQFEIENVVNRLDAKLNPVEADLALTSTQYASHESVELLYNHLAQVLTAIELIGPNKPLQTMRHLRHLFTRTRLSVDEVNLLRGILATLERKLCL